MIDQKEPDHTLTVPDRTLQIEITCPGCTNRFPEALSELVWGTRCPHCKDLLRYIREEEQNRENENTLEQTTLQ